MRIGWDATWTTSWVRPTAKAEITTLPPCETLIGEVGRLDFERMQKHVRTMRSLGVDAA